MSVKFKVQQANVPSKQGNVPSEITEVQNRKLKSKIEK
jgi:hypothetical protein